MSYNPNLTLVCEKQEINISLRHIQNLQEASSISNLDIMYTNINRPESVKLFINIEDDKLDIVFKNKEKETVSLHDFKYILSVLTLE